MGRSEEKERLERVAFEGRRLKLRGDVRDRKQELSDSHNPEPTISILVPYNHASNRIKR